ncbi:MAG TPA: response regulator transcription factor [Mycobacteriales bacterium]|nr:response regulator transcription factor [Mycobacteriales bacterium]
MTDVLVVEDDPGIGAALVRGLEREGYGARWVNSCAEASRAKPADVVILDLGLPDGDGVDLCRRLHDDTGAAIIVVTARGDEPDRVAALDAGADDYVVKPFGFAELFARIRAVLRRTQPSDGILAVGPVTIDTRAHRVTVNGESVTLTPREFDILTCLASDPGRVFTRREMFARVWGGNWYGPTKVLDVHIAAVRRKLGVPELIETVYGRGFRVAADA